MHARLPIAADWQCRAEGPYVFAPWLRLLPPEQTDLLSILPVLDVNGTLLNALEPGAPDAEQARHAVASLLLSDPFLRVRDVANALEAAGLSQICNFPTIQLVDGETAHSFNSAGLGAQREAEIVSAFSQQGFSVIGFCCDALQARALHAAGAGTLVLHPGIALSDWRHRAAAALSLARTVVQLRAELPDIPVRVYQPLGYGAELDQATAAADGIAFIAPREPASQSSSP